MQKLISKDHHLNVLLNIVALRKYIVWARTESVVQGLMGKNKSRGGPPLFEIIKNQIIIMWHSEMCIILWHSEMCIILHQTLMSYPYNCTDKNMCNIVVVSNCIRKQNPEPNDNILIRPLLDAHLYRLEAHTLLRKWNLYSLGS